MKKFFFILIINLPIIAAGQKSEWSNYFHLKEVEYKGGNGSSIDDAIYISNAKSIEIGLCSQYTYIEKLRGKIYKKWRPYKVTIEKKNENYYSTIVTQNIKDTSKYDTYIFNITELCNLPVVYLNCSK